jgi:hypothetical protein
MRMRRNASSRFRSLTLDFIESHKNYRPSRSQDARQVQDVERLQSVRSIYDLQQRPGHERIKTTEIYLK